MYITWANSAHGAIHQIEEKMPRLVGELNDQFAQSAELEAAIRSNLERLGYGG